MTDIKIADLSEWIQEFGPSAFFDAAETRPPGLGKDDRFRGLQKAMRDLVPVPGDTWVHDIDVLVKPHQADHQGQRWHSHPEWTAIYYVAIGSPPVPLEAMINDREVTVTPEPGDCIIIPPNVEHRVAASRSREYRLSFAMLVKDPGGKSKYVH